MSESKCNCEQAKRLESALEAEREAHGVTLHGNEALKADIRRLERDLAEAGEKLSPSWWEAQAQKVARLESELAEAKRHSQDWFDAFELAHKERDAALERVRVLEGSRFTAPIAQVQKMALEHAILGAARTLVGNLREIVAGDPDQGHYVLRVDIERIKRAVECAVLPTAPSAQPLRCGKQLPKRIYVERWPDPDRDDAVHYEPTGFGIDFATGVHSTITVYRRMTRAELAAERKARK